MKSTKGWAARRACAQSTCLNLKLRLKHFFSAKSIKSLPHHNVPPPAHRRLHTASNASGIDPPLYRSAQHYRHRHRHPRTPRPLPLSNAASSPARRPAPGLDMRNGAAYEAKARTGLLPPRSGAERTRYAASLSPSTQTLMHIYLPDKYIVFVYINYTYLQWTSLYSSDE